MKKLFAALLALVMVLSLSVSAFAVGNDSEGNPVTQPEGGPYIDVATIDLQMKYTTDMSTAGQVNPADRINFDVTVVGISDSDYTASNVPVPEAYIDVKEGDAKYGDGSSTGKIVLPEYEMPGKFTYRLLAPASENDTIGATYNLAVYSAPLYLTVTVNRVDGELVRVAALRTSQTGAKVETTEEYLTALYNASTLSVTNTLVDGAEEDLNRDYHVDITLSVVDVKQHEGKEMRSVITYTEGGVEKTIQPEAWVNGEVTVRVAMKANETIKFTNIPTMTKWSLTQEDLGEEFETTYTKRTGEINKLSYLNKATITNTRVVPVTEPDTDIPVDTGIALDSMPYVLMLAAAAIGCAALVSKKRED